MKETLTKKLGPLPMYMWVALAALAAGGFLLWKRSHAASAAAGTSTTAASTLPASATTGYVMGQDNGSQGWQGFDQSNNQPATQGPTSTLAPTYYPLNTVEDIKRAVGAGLGIVEQVVPAYGDQPAVYTPYKASTLPTSSIWKLPGTASATGYKLYTTGLPDASSVAAAGGMMLPGTVAPVNTPVLNAGNPASAIAPSALQGNSAGGGANLSLPSVSGGAIPFQPSGQVIGKPLSGVAA